MLRLLLFISLPLYILDQLTKFWTVARFSEPPRGYFGTSDPPIVVVEDFFHIIRVHNQGVAFGMGNGTPWAPVVFLVVPIVALVLIRWFWVKGVFGHLLSRLAVALLLCGIFGNLTDRLVQGFRLAGYAGESFWTRLSAGYVVDFIHVKLPLYGWWPAFNVADSCICVAAGLLFIGSWREDAARAAASKEA